MWHKNNEELVSNLKGTQYSTLFTRFHNDNPDSDITAIYFSVPILSLTQASIEHIRRHKENKHFNRGNFRHSNDKYFVKPTVHKIDEDGVKLNLHRSKVDDGRWQESEKDKKKLVKDHEVHGILYDLIELKIWFKYKKSQEEFTAKTKYLKENYYCREQIYSKGGVSTPSYYTLCTSASLLDKELSEANIFDAKITCELKGILARLSGIEKNEDNIAVSYGVSRLQYYYSYLDVAFDNSPDVYEKDGSKIVRRNSVCKKALISNIAITQVKDNKYSLCLYFSDMCKLMDLYTILSWSKSMHDKSKHVLSTLCDIVHTNMPLEKMSQPTFFGGDGLDYDEMKNVLKVLGNYKLIPYDTDSDLELDLYRPVTSNAEVIEDNSVAAISYHFSKARLEKKEKSLPTLPLISKLK